MGLHPLAPTNADYSLTCLFRWDFSEGCLASALECTRKQGGNVRSLTCNGTGIFVDSRFSLAANRNIQRMYVAKKSKRSKKGSTGPDASAARWGGRRT